MRRRDFRSRCTVAVGRGAVYSALAVRGAVAALRRRRAVSAAAISNVAISNVAISNVAISNVAISNSVTRQIVVTMNRHAIDDPQRDDPRSSPVAARLAIAVRLSVDWL